MALILTRDDVKSVLTMKDCIDVVEDAFKQLALGNVVMPTRPTIRIPKYKATVNAMPAYIGGVDALGLKLVGGYLDNPTKGLPTVQATILLIDGTNGSTLAVMDGTFITAVRTGAASGVATKHLAAEDATTAAIIGAGVQARTQLAAVCQVRPISSARVFARSGEHRREFASEMSRSMGIEVTPAESAEEAVRGAQIVCTASTSKTPVLDGTWLEPGVHVNCAGSHSPDARELDTTTVVRSTVVVDSRDAALAEAGDLLIPIANGDIAEDHIKAELGEVVAGTKPGRSDPGEITLFKSQGLAIQDVATASLVFRLASERGIGTQVNL